MNEVKPIEYLQAWAKLIITIEKPIKQIAMAEVQRFTINDTLKIALVSFE